MTREKSQAVLRRLFTDAQDAPPEPSTPERIALTAVDELERALARNAILERTVKRQANRIAALDGALQNQAKRLVALAAATPENARIIKELNRAALDAFEGDDALPNVCAQCERLFPEDQLSPRGKHADVPDELICDECRFMSICGGTA